jgi:heme exporter protein C
MKAKSKLLSVLDVVTIVLFLTATVMVFFYAPMERVMGLVQKVFYFHVATAWIGMLGFFVAMVAGIIYLATHRTRPDASKWDIVALAGVEIGLVFTLICIVTGSIWARPIWNSWWTWDPRLTTVTIMELAYAAYLMLRAGIEDPERRARFGAVYSIVAFISVPLTFFSIRIWRTIHPVVIGSGDPTASGAFDMTAKMGLTFALSLVAFSFIFVTLLWHRIRMGHLAEKVEQLKLRLTQ